MSRPPRSGEVETFIDELRRLCLHLSTNYKIVRKEMEREKFIFLIQHQHIDLQLINNKTLLSRVHERDVSQ